MRRMLFGFAFLVTFSSFGCYSLPTPKDVVAPSKEAVVLRPSITGQPKDVTVVASNRAVFSVVATGSAPLRFQWKLDGTPIPGATLPSYTTPITQATESGARYSVGVTNSLGTVDSNIATLTVSARSQLTASYSTIDFGNITVGKIAKAQLTFAALGKSNVTLTSISVSGLGFNLTNVPTELSLSPGQTTTIDVTFSPSNDGNATGNISIANDGSNPVMNISVSGHGLAPKPHSISLMMFVPGLTNTTGCNVYRSTVSGGPYSMVSQLVGQVTSFNDVDVEAGGTYYYVTTVVDSNSIESEPSEQVTGTVPSD